MVDAAGLQRSFGIVAGLGDEVPLYFYSRLFLEHPHLHAMFPPSMSAQRDRLIASLGALAGNLQQLETVVPYLQQLARDHRKYGVLHDHYPAFGGVLLATLEHFLGDDWTPALAADWAAAYGLVATVMTQAADTDADTAPAWYDAEITRHEIRAPGVAVLTVRSEPRLEYIAGQSIPVQLPAMPRIWRYFSPAAAARPDGLIELHVRAVAGGWLSPALVHTTARGDVLRLGAAVGTGLQLDRSTRPIVMLAGGTGLAPLRALVDQLAGQVRDGRTPRLVRCYPGARSEPDLYDLPALRRLQDDHGWLDVQPVVRRGGTPGLAAGDVATAALAHQPGGAQELAACEIYLCGSPRMVEHTLRTLATAGVAPGRVRRETHGYGPKATSTLQPAPAGRDHRRTPQPLATAGASTRTDPGLDDDR